MVTIRATYDGKSLHLSQPVSVNKEEDVRVVFLNRDQLDEDSVSGKNVGDLISASKSLHFLDSKEEDIYSDANLKVKY